MLDIKYIIENQKHIEDIIQKRGMKAQLPELISLYHKRKQLILRKSAQKPTKLPSEFH